MKNFRIYKLLLIGIFALTAGSCDTTEEPDSVITSFEKFSPIINTPEITAPEGDEATYTLNFEFDDRQVTDMVVDISVSSSSTATEDVDFELSTHQIELLAFEGKDGFSVDITILQDFEPDEEDETIYLTLSTESPSGLQVSDILVATITESGVPPQPSETVNFALRWEFTTPPLPGTDICEYGFDLDMTFQTSGSDPYDDDLLAYATSTVSCPEEGTLSIEDMEDGVVYDVWILIYAGVDLGEFSAITVFVDYERENSDFSGTVEIEGIFDSKMEEDGGILMTIERNGNVITLRDGDANIIGEGRVPTRSAKLQPVKKRI